MNTIEEIELVRERLEKAHQDAKIVLDNAVRKLRNVRLTRKEVARLMEYNSVKYTYSIDPPIPFDSEGMIFYDDLEQWTHKHKSNRLKRLRSNYRQYQQRFIK